MTNFTIGTTDCSKRICISVHNQTYVKNDCRRSRNRISFVDDEFWSQYKMFVLCLLFANYKTALNDENEIKERCDIIDLLYKCLSGDNSSILNEYCSEKNYDYEYDYVGEFKKCLKYMQRILIQSIEIGSGAYKTYCARMNQQYVKLQNKGAAIGSPWEKQLMDVIAIALDLPYNEQECQVLFE